MIIDNTLLDDKIKAYKGQYDLYRKTVKTSAFLSKELDKFTCEDLEYKPGVVEQGKFQYSLLDKVFNKGLEKQDKKEEP